MTRSFIESDNFLAVMKETLRKERIEAAEPVIQEALKQTETRMRERLAACLIARIDQQVDCYQEKDRLIVTIRCDGETS